MDKNLELIVKSDDKQHSATKELTTIISNRAAEFKALEVKEIPISINNAVNLSQETIASLTTLAGFPKKPSDVPKPYFIPETKKKELADLVGVKSWDADRSGNFNSSSLDRPVVSLKDGDDSNWDTIHSTFHEMLHGVAINVYSHLNDSLAHHRLGLAIYPSPTQKDLKTAWVLEEGYVESESIKFMQGLKGIPEFEKAFIAYKKKLDLIDEYQKRGSKFKIEYIDRTPNMSSRAQMRAMESPPTIFVEEKYVTDVVETEVSGRVGNLYKVFKPNKGKQVFAAVLFDRLIELIPSKEKKQEFLNQVMMARLDPRNITVMANNINQSFAHYGISYSDFLNCKHDFDVVQLYQLLEKT